MGHCVKAALQKEFNNLVLMKLKPVKVTVFH